MTIEEEQKLWKEYKRTGSEKIRNQLIEIHADLVRKAYLDIKSSLPEKVRYDEEFFCSAGYVALMRMVESYDIDSGFKFKTYAFSVIKGEMKREFSSLKTIRVPRNRTSKRKEINEIRRLLESETGQRVTDEEIAERMDLPKDAYRRYFLQVFVPHEVSLNVTYDDEDKSLMDSIGKDFRFSCEDEKPEPIDNKLAVLVDNMIDNLNERQRKIIRMYYWDKMTFRKIGKEMNVSAQYVAYTLKNTLIMIKRQYQEGMNK